MDPVILASKGRRVLLRGDRRKLWDLAALWTLSGGLPIARPIFLF